MSKELDGKEAAWAALIGTGLLQVITNPSSKDRVKYHLAAEIKKDVQPLLREAEANGARRLAEKLKKVDPVHYGLTPQALKEVIEAELERTTE